jgi:type II secretory pathway pseudopilin PulG
VHCTKCDADIGQSASCPVCGEAVALVPVDMRRPRAITVIAVVHIGAALLLGFGTFVAAQLLNNEMSHDTIDVPYFQALTAGLAILTIVHLAAAVGLFLMRRWGRVLQIILSIPGLLLIPIGTIVHAMILYFLTRPGTALLFSGKKEDELTPAERDAVANPRRIKLGRSVSATVMLVAGLTLVTLIVLAIAIPGMMSSPSLSARKRTMADIRSIATAVEAYQVDYDQYPPAKTFDELSRMISPTYIRQVPAEDAWGHKWWYSCWSTKGAATCDSYGIASAGKDGKFERSSISSYTPDDKTQSSDCDIVYSNGSFIRSPTGFK